MRGLSHRDFGCVDFLVGPYTRHLGGKVRETEVPSVTPADEGHLLAGARPAGDLTDGVSQDPQRRDC